MKRKIISLVLVELFFTALIVHAGWTHIPGGKTKWQSSRGTDATLWRRDATLQDVYPVKAGNVQVFFDTIRYIIPGTAPANTTHIGTGLWEIDANGDYMPIDVTADMYENRRDAGGRVGIEWELDENGDLMLKL